jgi:hypothetical protein
MRDTIACIVEGRGEVAAVPILLRRIAYSAVGADVGVPQPMRLNRNKMLVDDELTRFARFAASTAGSNGSLLVLADADDDCPVDLAQSRLAVLSSLELPHSVVFAQCEFESWFLAAAESLSGKRGMLPDLVSPARPEEVSNPKKWLERHHRDNQTGMKRWCYSETTDQPGFAHYMDIDAARRCASFDKFVRSVTSLIDA